MDRKQVNPHLNRLKPVNRAKVFGGGGGGPGGNEGILSLQYYKLIFYFILLALEVVCLTGSTLPLTSAGSNRLTGPKLLAGVLAGTKVGDSGRAYIFIPFFAMHACQ